MKIDKKIKVLIPDGESFFALSVINCLSDIENIEIHLIYTSKEINGVQYSNKIDSFVRYTKTDKEIDFINFINQEIIKKKIDVLMPLHVEAIRLASRHELNFNKLNIKILGTEVETLNKVNNKWKLSEFLTTHAIPVPKTVQNFEDINELKYPILYKPVKGTAGGLGIKLIKNKTDLKNIRNKSEEFILQEYLKGYDIDCNVLCKDGDILAYTIQKGIMKSSNPFAPPTAVKFLLEEKLYNMMKDLFKSLNYTGVANVDLLFDEVEKEYKLIEINPRFWGSVEASNKVGVNFPYLYCLTCLGIKFDIPTYKFEIYANNRALLNIIKSKFHLKRTITPNHLAIKNDIFDPLPKIVKYSNKAFKKVFD